VHVFNGETESGKSWLAQAATAEVLCNGGTALYLDFESTKPPWRGDCWRSA
jgi:hypothetical protein